MTSAKLRGRCQLPILQLLAFPSCDVAACDDSEHIEEWKLSRNNSRRTVFPRYRHLNAAEKSCLSCNISDSWSRRTAYLSYESVCVRRRSWLKQTVYDTDRIQTAYPNRAISCDFLYLWRILHICRNCKVSLRCGASKRVVWDMPMRQNVYRKRCKSTTPRWNEHETGATGAGLVRQIACYIDRKGMVSLQYGFECGSWGRSFLKTVYYIDRIYTVSFFCPFQCTGIHTWHLDALSCVELNTNWIGNSYCTTHRRRVFLQCVISHVFWMQPNPWISSCIHYRYEVVRPSNFRQFQALGQKPSHLVSWLFTTWLTTDSFLVHFTEIHQEPSFCAMGLQMWFERL